MSLSDKIIEILKENPMIGTVKIRELVDNKYNISPNLRTYERHIGKLLEQREIEMAGYNRKKHSPLYMIWKGGSKYDSIMDCPEASEADWSKIPLKMIPSLIHLWYRGKDTPPFRDQVRATLRHYIPRKD